MRNYEMQMPKGRGEKRKNRAHVVVHHNIKGKNDEEYVTNEEKERRQESKEARYR